MSVQAAATIGERGYRRYDGPRRGEGAAVISVWRHTIQRVLGLRRAARHKVLPFLTIIIAFLPAIAFIGVLALLPRTADDGSQSTDFVPTYSEYYGFVSAAILLFVVFVAPEALCPDRRSKSLSLYLASPLRRDTYLAAKLIGDLHRVVHRDDGPSASSCSSATRSRTTDPTGRSASSPPLRGSSARARSCRSSSPRSPRSWRASPIARALPPAGRSSPSSPARSSATRWSSPSTFRRVRSSSVFSCRRSSWPCARSTARQAATCSPCPRFPRARSIAAVGAWIALFLVGVWIRYSTVQVTR